MPTIIRALLLALFLCFDVAFSFRLHRRHTYLLEDSNGVVIAGSREGSAHPEPKQSQFDELEKQLYEG